jgi:hypothetical protein
VTNDRLLACAGAFAIDGRRGTKGHTVRELGFEPKAVVLWWTRQSDEGVVKGNEGGIGFWAPGSSGVATGWTSANGVSRSRAYSAHGHSVVICPTGTSTNRCPEGRIGSVHEDGFVFAWVVPPDTRIMCHFLALGGEAIHAQTGSLTLPEGGGRVDVPLRDIRPDVIFVCPAGATAGAAVGSLAGFGASDGRRQAATSYSVADGALPGRVATAQRTDAVLVLAAHERKLLGRARLRTSRRPSLDWVPAERVGCDLLYLAVTGLRCRVGATEAPPARSTRRVRRLGFRPCALVFSTWGLAPSRDAKRIGRLALGAVSTEPSRSVCASWDDRPINAPETATHARSSATEAVVVADSRTGGVHAAASVDSVDDDGFTLAWTVSDTPRRQVLYVALGARRRSIVRTLTTRFHRALQSRRQGQVGPRRPAEQAMKPGRLERVVDPVHDVRRAQAL